MPPVFAQAVGFTADANTILALCALVTAVGAGLVFVCKRYCYLPLCWVLIMHSYVVTGS